MFTTRMLGLLLTALMVAGCGASTTKTVTVTVAAKPTPVQAKKSQISHKSVPILQVLRKTETPPGAGFTATFPVSAGAEVGAEVMRLPDYKDSEENTYDTTVEVNEAGTRACYYTKEGEADTCGTELNEYNVGVKGGQHSLKPLYCRHSTATPTHLGGHAALRYQCWSRVTEVIAIHNGTTYRVTMAREYSPALRELSRQFLRSFHFVE